MQHVHRHTTYMTWGSLQNLLLESIPKGVALPLRSHLDLVPLKVGELLYQAGAHNPSVFFPLTCIVSIQVLQRDGVVNEVVSVGNEGFIGASLFSADIGFQSRAIVRGAGHAFRLPQQVFNDTLAREGHWLQELLRFTQALMLQSAQAAACNRHHSIEQQLCRLLLSSRDRVMSDPLHLTHDMIATLLGVRREGVSEAAGKLQRAGLIRYSHGKILLLDRRGLEQRACECYDVVRFALARLITRGDSDPHRVEDRACNSYL